MALKDLYGIGKGEAQVFDTSRVSDLLAEKRAVDRKAHADKLAKQAVKQAALGSMVNDLSTKGAHEKDVQEYLGEQKKKIRNFYQQGIVDYGEAGATENVEFNKELNNMVNDFRDDAEWSVSSVANRKKMLDQRLKTGDDVNMEDVKAYNEWANKDFRYRRTHPMPFIRDEEISMTERIKTKGYADVIGGMRKKVKYSAPIGGGKQRNIEGYAVDEAKFKTYIDNLADNDEDPLRNDIFLDAAISAENEGIKKFIGVDEQGNEIPNPKFLERQKELGREMLETTLRPYIKEVGVGGFTVSEAGAGAGDDEPTVIVKGSKEENKIKRIVTKELPEELKRTITDVAQGDDGNKYFQFAGFSTPLAEKEFKKAYKEKYKRDFKGTLNTGGWYEIGTLKPKPETDNRGNEIKLSSIKTIEEVEAGDTYNIGSDIKLGNISQIDKYINNKGYMVKASPGSGVKKGTTNKIRYNVNYNIGKGGKVIFEGEEGYDDSENKKKTNDFVAITGTGQKGFTETPVTKAMLETNEKFREAYDAGKADVGAETEVVEEETKAAPPKKGDTRKVQGGIAEFNGIEWVMKK